MTCPPSMLVTRVIGRNTRRRPGHLDDEPDHARAWLGRGGRRRRRRGRADLVPLRVEDGQARQPRDEDPRGRSAHAAQAIARPVPFTGDARRPARCRCTSRLLRPGPADVPPGGAGRRCGRAAGRSWRRRAGGTTDPAGVSCAPPPAATSATGSSRVIVAFRAHRSRCCSGWAGSERSLRRLTASTCAAVPTGCAGPEPLGASSDRREPAARVLAGDDDLDDALQRGQLLLAAARDHEHGAVVPDVPREPMAHRALGPQPDDAATVHPSATSASCSGVRPSEAPSAASRASLPAPSSVPPSCMP